MQNGGIEMIKLKIEKVNLSFGTKKIFDDANLVIDKPGLYCLIGRNGCGKSTLLKACAGLISLENGKIKIEGTNINKENLVSYVQADPLVFDSITVFENLKLFCENDNEIHKLLEEFGISYLKYQKGKNCSAGEKQRVSIIRGILEDRPILLLDEATSHLDDETSNYVLEYIKKLSTKKIIIYATHYLYEVQSYADAIIEIENHKILKTKDTAQGEIETFNSSGNGYDLKIFKKIINWKGKWIFTPLIAFLAIALMIFSAVATTTEARMIINQYSDVDQYCVIKWTERNDYTIKPFDIEEGDIKSTPYKEAYYSFVSPIFDELLSQEFVVLKDSKKNEIFEFYSTIITDDFEGEYLLENEVAISKYAYDIIKECSDVYQKTDDGEYFFFCDLKYKIKKVYYVEPLYYETKLQKMYYERFANPIYMNRTTWHTMAVTKSFPIEENIYNDSFEIVEGNSPQNPLEIVWDQSRRTRRNIGSKETINGVKYTIVGFANGEFGPDVCCYYDLNSFLQRHNQDIIYQTQTVAIDVSKLSVEDSQFLIDNQMIICSNITYGVMNNENEFMNYRRICMICSSILFVLFVATTVLSTFLEFKDSDSKYTLLNHTSIPKKKIKKTLLKIDLITGFFWIVTFLISYNVYYYATKERFHPYNYGGVIMVLLAVILCGIPLIHYSVFSKRGGKKCSN